MPVIPDGVAGTCSQNVVPVPTPSIVTPLNIFAAGRQSFEAIVRDDVDADMAKYLLFDTLPLDQHGWDFETAIIHQAGFSLEGFPIWRLERGAC